MGILLYSDRRNNILWCTVYEKMLFKNSIVFLIHIHNFMLWIITILEDQLIIPTLEIVKAEVSV